MNCPNCQHQNIGGNFCEQCGTRLAASETAATTESYYQRTDQASTQPNKQIEMAKKVSKMYLSYFMTVIKKPYVKAQNVGNEQFVNGLITIGLYALFIPLVMFFGLGEVKEYMASPFFDIVLKPTLAYFVFILLVATYTFGAVKLGKIDVSYKDVIARFGTTLVPFVVLFAIAIMFAIFKFEMLFVLLMVLGFVASIFTIPALVIASFKKSVTQGLDAIYGTVLTYITTFITIGIMADLLFSVLETMIKEYFSSLFFL